MTYNTQGTHTITWTFDDGNGNSITVEQDVIINDTTPPTITCPVNVTVNANASCQATGVNLGNPTTSDNCSVENVSNNAPSTFPIGNTTVTWTATDIGGNTTTCSQIVTVQDVTPPTAICQDISIQLNSAGDATIAATDIDGGSTDNCGIASLNASQTAFTCANLGSNTVTLTVTDIHGNSSTCDAVVTVEDDEAPTINCPTDKNVDFEDNCEFTLLDYTSEASTSDNCDNNLTLTQSPPAGSVLSGAVVVTITATDNSNNFSTCSFNVVPSDNEAPIAACTDYTAVLSPSGVVNIAASNLDNGSSDNCGIANMTVTPSSFNCSDVGPNTVTFTVYDDAGNFNSCTATVNVEDNTPPTAVCTDFVVVIDAITRDASITAENIDNGSTDACGVASITVNPSVFDEAADGLLYVATTTLTVTDVNGNESTCIANVTVEPPKNLNTYMTGVITNPTPDNPQPPSPLVEVTACPGELLDGVTVLFNLQSIAPYNLVASDVIHWEVSYDYGETWAPLTTPPSSGTLTYSISGITNDTFVRAVIVDPDTGATKTTAESYVRFLPPDEPPIITSISPDPPEICLGEAITVTAESFFDQPNGQFGEGGEFNYAQPEGWRVDGIDGFFPASGNTTTQPTWKETNSNNNQVFSGINYDTLDNTKFAMANGVGNDTTLETPVFSTIGMTSSEAIMTFLTSWYFCNGGYGKILLSFDSGNTYPVELNTVENYDFDSVIGGTTTSGVILASGPGNKCMGQTDPRMFSASIDLGAYTGLSGLRIMFEFHGSDTDCGIVTSSTFPNPNGVSCSSNGNNANTLGSGWAVDQVGFAYAYVDEEIEWTDEDDNIVSTSTEATITPVTPGIRTYGVTSLVNGCRTENDEGTAFVDFYTSLAYAGQDYTPLNSECGENALQLNAYDNTKTATENFIKGAYETNLYVVPDTAAGDTDYPGTGVMGTWSVQNASYNSCGSSAIFSSETDPDAIFLADPGIFTLRWTLSNGCFDEITVEIKDCPTVDFDGINDHVTFRNNYQLNSDFSLEVWVKPNSTNGTRTVFSRKEFGNTTSGYDLSIVDGQIRFRWGNAGGTGQVTSGGNTVGTNRWYHLAVTFDGSLYTLYVDGIVLGTASGTAPSNTSGNIEALIGAMDQSPPNEPTNYYHGWVDELRIWNKALSYEHIHQMMNQEIQALGSDVGGVVLLNKIDGPDFNQDGVDDDPLLWNDLEGYYRMNLTCGNLAAYKGVTGRLRNITTSQQQTAPLPYITTKNGNWDNDSTTASPWLYYSVWDHPNSNGINGEAIDWNIVRTNHNVISDVQDITLLGLLVDSNELTIKDTGADDETNNGHGLWITHYLKLNGQIDLIGESQLVQKRYTIDQLNDSELEPASGGFIERDQQGTNNLYNYNYWSSPVSAIGAATNSNFTVANILRDGTTSSNPATITWIGGYNANPGPPISMPNYWLWTYNAIANTYLQWNQVGSTGSIPTGNGYTMKGSGTGNGYQNYVFKGKPHNGLIQNANTSVSNGNEILIGNPYPSALDADEFIKDNIPNDLAIAEGSAANPGSTNAIDGALYFWVHYITSNSHYLADYEGGYATYNLSGGEIPTTPPITEDGYEISDLGNSTLMPGRYVPVGQGFFVGALEPGTGGQIKFENDQRVFERESGSGSSIFLKTTNNANLTSSNNENESIIQRVRITASMSNNLNRHLMLAFVPNSSATDGYDYGYDAKNIDTYSSDVSWNINDANFVIQGVSEFDSTKQYPLNIELAQAGDLAISLRMLENFDEDEIEVFIYDSVTDEYTQFNDVPFYINLDAGEYNSRFFLTFESDESTLSIIEDMTNNVSVNYLNNSGEIFINTFNQINIRKVQLIDMGGKVIQTWSHSQVPELSNSKIKLPVQRLSSGNYIIKLDTDLNTSISKKVIVE
nr:LamG-like jellyroll fold domain-containing protein [Mangrovimonas futianensis]